jgi:hypothetical protein
MSARAHPVVAKGDARGCISSDTLAVGQNLLA